MVRVTRLRLVAFTLSIALSYSRVLAQDPSGTCFYPDGYTIAHDVPCNQSAIDNGEHSACCGSSSFCMDNGHCVDAGIVSRGSCTDPTWESSSCAPYCRSNPTGGNPMFPCVFYSQPPEYNGSTWTCGFNNTNCLTQTDVFVMEGGAGIVLRGDQVAALQGGSAAALSINPTSTLAPGGDGDSDGSSPSSSAAESAVSTVTSYVPAAFAPSSSSNSTQRTPNSSSQQFTAADVAGASLGSGLPFMLAFAGAVIVIFRQRQQLRKTQTALNSMMSDNMPRSEKTMDSMHSQNTNHYAYPPTQQPPPMPQSNTSYTSPFHIVSPPNATTHPMVQARHEVGSHEIGEMDTHGEMVEIDDGRTPWK